MLEKLKTEEKVIIQFRRGMSSSGLEHILDNLSEEEVYKVISLSSIACGHSSVLTKKTIFSYVFFNHDSKITNSTLEFFKEIVDLKEEITISSKRMITFFLGRGVLSSIQEARSAFLSTYGYHSKTRYTKSISPIDKAKFNKFYNGFVRTIIGAIRNPSLKRFPHLGLLKKAKK